MQRAEVYNFSREEVYQISQWDKDIYVIIEGYADSYTGSGICQVHFYNALSPEALVVEAQYSITDSQIFILCKIPNKLLMNPYDIYGEVVMLTGAQHDGPHAILMFSIDMLCKPQPSDYVVPGSEDYITVEQAILRCENAADHAEGSEVNAALSAYNASSSESKALTYKNSAETSARDAADSLVDANKAANLSKYYADSAEQSAEDAAAAAGSNLFSIAVNPTNGLLCIYYNGEDEIEPGPYPRPEPSPTPPPDPEPEPEPEDNNT